MLTPEELLQAFGVDLPADVIGGGGGRAGSGVGQEGGDLFGGMQAADKSAQECVNVTFLLHKSSHFVGQQVFLSGSCVSLGEWDASVMVPLVTTEATFPLWTATVALPVFAKTAYRYYVLNPAASEGAPAEAVPETTGVADSLFALGDNLRQMGDSCNSEEAATVLRPERLVPPPQPPAGAVREIVRSVSVHRRSLVVRDTFGKELLVVDAAHTEIRPSRS